MQETRIWSLSQEDPLEEEMEIHSSFLAWEVLRTEEPGGLLSIGSHRIGHKWSHLACMHALGNEMATHSSVLAWRIPGTEEPGELPSMGSHRVRHDWSDSSSGSNQYSCLGNPMDRGAWWATVYRIAKSQTRLSNWTFTQEEETVELCTQWPYKDTARGQLSVNQKEHFKPRVGSASALILDFSSFRMLRDINKCLLFKPPGLWYFGVAAQAD